MFQGILDEAEEGPLLTLVPLTHELDLETSSCPSCSPPILLLSSLYPPSSKSSLFLIYRVYTYPYPYTLITYDAPHSLLRASPIPSAVPIIGETPRPFSQPTPQQPHVERISSFERRHIDRRQWLATKIPLDCYPLCLDLPEGQGVAHDKHRQVYVLSSQDNPPSYHRCLGAALGATIQGNAYVVPVPIDPVESPVNAFLCI